MIYEARVTGVYAGKYWVNIPAKFGTQDVGPIDAAPTIAPAIGDYVYVGELPVSGSFLLLTGKDPSPVPVQWADIAGKPAAFPSAWATVSGKPTTFAPSAHTHLWADLTDKPSTFAPSAHTHAGADITTGTISDARIANATAALDGLIPKADKAKLDAATASPTVSTLAMRDVNGGLQVITPAAGLNYAANRSYVDAGDATRAPLSHTHSAADLITGTLPDARLVGGYSMTTLRLTATADASETSTGHAFQIGADNTLNIIFDNNEIIGRNNGALSGINMPGGITVPPPTAGGYATRMDYVDGQVATRAPLSHVHSGSNITSGTISDARIANATAALDGLLNKTDKAKLDAATASNSNSTLVMRDSTGHVNTSTPTGATHAANMSYVDSTFLGLELVSIPASQNLNNYTTTGRFYQGNNNAAAGGTNYPGPFAGRLLVDGTSTFTWQEYTFYASAGAKLSGVKMTRARFNSTWTQWTSNATDAPAVWETIPISGTSYKLYDSALPIKISESGGWVNLNGAVTVTANGNANNSNAVVAGLIPSKYMPPAQSQVMVWRCQASNNDSFGVTIEGDGRLNINRYGPGTGNVGVWLPFNVSWKL